MLGRMGDARALGGTDVDITVNGTPETVPHGTTVADLVRAWCPSPDGIAVACNRAVVPKSEWSARPLAARDRVEIVTAAAGG